MNTSPGGGKKPHGLTDDLKLSLRIDVAKVYATNQRTSFELAPLHGDQPAFKAEPLSQESTQASAIPSHEVHTSFLEPKLRDDEHQLALIPDAAESPFSRSVSEHCVCIGGSSAEDVHLVEKQLTNLNFQVVKWILTRTNKQYVYVQGGLPERKRLLSRKVLAIIEARKAPSLVTITDPSKDGSLTASLSESVSWGKRQSVGVNSNVSESITPNYLERIRMSLRKDWRQIGMRFLSGLLQLIVPTILEMDPMIKMKA